MTGPDDRTPSFDDELTQDAAEVLELAAASACLDAQRLLEQAVLRRPDLSQAGLAELLQVSQGRVSQVLHGEGVQNLALLARYLRALGYDVRLDAEPVDDEVPALTRRGRARRPTSATDQPAPAAAGSVPAAAGSVPAAAGSVPAAAGHLYKQVFASRAGVYETTAMVPAPANAEGLTPLGGPQLTATWRVGASGLATFTSVTPAEELPAAHQDPAPEHAVHPAVRR